MSYINWDNKRAHKYNSGANYQMIPNIYVDGCYVNEYGYWYCPPYYYGYRYPFNPYYRRHNHPGNRPGHRPPPRPGGRGNRRLDIVTTVKDAITNIKDKVVSLKDQLTTVPSITPEVQQKVQDVANQVSNTRATIVPSEPDFHLQFNDLHTKTQSLLDLANKNSLAITEIKSSLDQIKQKLTAIVDQLKIKEGQILIGSEVTPSEPTDIPGVPVVSTVPPVKQMLEPTVPGPTAPKVPQQVKAIAETKVAPAVKDIAAKIESGVQKVMAATPAEIQAKLAPLAAGAAGAVGAIATGLSNVMGNGHEPAVVQKVVNGQIVSETPAVKEDDLAQVVPMPVSEVQKAADAEAQAMNSEATAAVLTSNPKKVPTDLVAPKNDGEYEGWKTKAEYPDYLKLLKFVVWRDMVGRSKCHDYYHYFMWNDAMWKPRADDRHYNRFHHWKSNHHPHEAFVWNIWRHWKNKKADYKRRYKQYLYKPISHDANTFQQDKKYFDFKKSANVKDFAKFKRYGDWCGWCNRVGRDTHDMDAFQTWMRYNNKQYSNEKVLYPEFKRWKEEISFPDYRLWHEWNQWRKCKACSYEWSTITSESTHRYNKKHHQSSKTYDSSCPSSKTYESTCPSSKSNDSSWPSTKSETTCPRSSTSTCYRYDDSTCPSTTNYTSSCPVDCTSCDSVSSCPKSTYSSTC